MSPLDARELFAVYFDRRTLGALRALVRAAITGTPVPARSRTQADALRSIRLAHVRTRRTWQRVSPLHEQRDEASGEGLRVFREVGGRVIIERLVRRGGAWVPDVLPIWVIPPEQLNDVRTMLRDASDVAPDIVGAAVAGGRAMQSDLAHAYFRFEQSVQLPIAGEPGEFLAIPKQGPHTLQVIAPCGSQVRHRYAWPPADVRELLTRLVSRGVLRLVHGSLDALTPHDGPPLVGTVRVAMVAPIVADAGELLVIWPGHATHTLTVLEATGQHVRRHCPLSDAELAAAMPALVATVDLRDRHGNHITRWSRGGSAA